MERERRVRGKVSTDTTARVLRYVLEKTHRTQAQLAEDLEVSESFISRALRGERNLTLDHLQQIEDKFDMPTGAMFLAITKPGTDPKFERLRHLARELLLQGDRVSAAIKASRRRDETQKTKASKRASA
jgi:transcriptional regulator with XRE-family HTH domain